VPGFPANAGGFPGALAVPSQGPSGCGRQSGDWEGAGNSIHTAVLFHGEKKPQVPKVKEWFHAVSQEDYNGPMLSSLYQVRTWFEKIDNLVWGSKNSDK